MTVEIERKWAWARATAAAQRKNSNNNNYTNHHHWASEERIAREWLGLILQLTSYIMCFYTFCQANERARARAVTAAARPNDDDDDDYDHDTIIFSNRGNVCHNTVVVGCCFLCLSFAARFIHTILYYNSVFTLFSMFFGCCCAFFVVVVVVILLLCSRCVYFVIWFALCRCFIHFSLLLPMDCVCVCVCVYLSANKYMAFFSLSIHPSRILPPANFTLSSFFTQFTLSLSLYVFYDLITLVWFFFYLFQYLLYSLFST